MSSSEVDASDLGGELSSTTLFADLPENVRELVETSLIRSTHAFGDVVVRQGDPPDGVYIVGSGRLRVVREEYGTEFALGVLTRGDVFGETATIDGTPRQATVRASEPSELLRLEPGVFAGLVRIYPQFGERLQALAQIRKRAPLLRGHAVFSALPLEAVDAVLSELDEMTLPARSVIFADGDPPGPLYLLAEGRVRVIATDGTTLNYLRAGDLFGELSVYTGAPRSATIETVSDVRLLAMDAATFARLQDAYPDLRGRVADQVALYERGPAQAVPLDFADELRADENRDGTDTRHVTDRDEADRGRRSTPALPSPRRSLRRGTRHVPHVRQLDEMDCGAACIAMCCRRFGRAVSLSRIRELVGTSIDGTSLDGIVRGGEAVGLDVGARKVSKDRLDELELPAIIHWKGDHWMVLDEVRADRVHVADPGTTRRWIARDEFLAEWTGFGAVVSPTERLRQAPLERAELRWLLPFVRPYYRPLAALAVLSVFAAGVQMLIPVLIGNIIDTVLPHGDTSRLNALTAGMFALIALALLASLAVAKLTSSVALRIDGATLDHIAGRLLALPMSYFESRRTGDIERRLDGMRQVRDFALREGMIALTSVAAVIVAFVLMVLTAPSLAAVWLVTAPVYLLLMRAATRKLRPAFAEMEEGFGRYRSRRLDAIHGIETVKALGVEPPLQRRMLADFNDFGGRVVRADRLSIAYTGAITFVSASLLLLFLYLGSREVISHDLSIGKLVAFNSLVLLASAPVVALLETHDRWQYVSVLLGRMQDILAQEPEQAHADGLRAVPTLEGRLTLHNVGFRYPQTPDAPILSGIDLDIRPGMTVAFVGRSGAGKSTLLKCLAGLLRATDGAIAFDSVDLRELDWGELRRRIGFVPQRPHVFDDTIARNIAFAEPDPDMDAVRAAAEIADAHEFVERFPLGFETRVGDGGLRLSGGQAQRIAIARAVYHRPPIVLLDEATSALDTEAERAVAQNIARFMDGRTAVIVANRLSTIRDADMIVVLERGRIAEMGTHSELLAAGGLYLYLYGQQLAT